MRTLLTSTLIFLSFLIHPAIFLIPVHFLSLRVAGSVDEFLALHDEKNPEFPASRKQGAQILHAHWNCPICPKMQPNSLIHQQHFEPPIRQTFCLLRPNALCDPNQNHGQNFPILNDAAINLRRASP